MKFKNVCSAAATVFIGACTAQPSASPAALSNRDYIVDIYLPAEQWLPTRNQAAEAKAALLTYLASDTLPAYGSQGSFTMAYRNIVAARIDSYSLQYFGGHYVWTERYAAPDLSGEADILINGLCEGPWLKGENPTKQLIEVNDGGACFFHAFYSPAQKKILQFSINGNG
jgi:hypothetical protein